MKPLFGNLFDFDGDGYASPYEELLGIEMLKSAEKKQKNDCNYDHTMSWNEYGENDDNI